MAQAAWSQTVLLQAAVLHLLLSHVAALHADLAQVLVAHLPVLHLPLSQAAHSILIATNSSNGENVGAVSSEQVVLHVPGSIGWSLKPSAVCTSSNSKAAVLHEESQPEPSLVNSRVMYGIFDRMLLEIPVGQLPEEHSGGPAASGAASTTAARATEAAPPMMRDIHTRLMATSFRSEGEQTVGAYRPAVL